MTYRLLRLKAIVDKELLLMKHDYMTYLFLIIVPFLQLLFFGYVIDTDPKYLPTLVISSDHGPFSQSIINGLATTRYFDIKGIAKDEKEAERMLKLGKVEFVINIPAGFSKKIIRGLNPHILIESDATDPITIGSAYKAANYIIPSILNRNLQGSLHYLLQNEPSVTLDLHSKYNPSVRSQYHSLPGLIAITLTSILVMLTAISIASEYDNGTMETLLVTPLKPLELIVGKLIPNFIVGYIIYFLLVATSYWIYQVPMYGSVIVLSFVAGLFIIATLSVGVLASVVANSQFRAMSYANLYILPSILLCGFLFPFYGMPKFAQNIGDIFPTTHFTRVVYNIMLKEATFIEILPDVWPLILFIIVILGLSKMLYRKTLD